MNKIQEDIENKVRTLIRGEISRHLRHLRNRNRVLKEELMECRNQIAHLEKIADARNEKTIEQWLERTRQNGSTTKKLQQRLGITQKELASLLGTDPATISRWISGKVKLSRKSSEKLAAIYNMTKAEVRHNLKK